LKQQLKKIKRIYSILFFIIPGNDQRKNNQSLPLNMKRYRLIESIDNKFNNY